MPFTTADIAADAGVTERTLFRYFPNKVALVLDEAIALLPEMFQTIAERPAGEPPYQAVCEGVVDFALRHRDLLNLLIPQSPAGPALPFAGQQRTLIDFEDTLAGVLRQRYAVPGTDQITPAVWARGQHRRAARRARRHRAPSPCGRRPRDPGHRHDPACFAALSAAPPASSSVNPLRSGVTRLRLLRGA
jgi:AcrR family transcriptional regulator